MVKRDVEKSTSKIEFHVPKFYELGFRIKKICNMIPKDRGDAIHIHKKMGFVEVCEKSDKRIVFLQKTL